MSKIKTFFVETSEQKSSYSYLKPLQQRSKIKYRNSFKNFKLSLKKKSFKPNVGTIKFDLLNIFYTVVTCGSINSASERLILTQPAITLSLQKLEKELGCTLFVKAKNMRGINLTPFGLLFFNYVQRVLHLIIESFYFSNPAYSTKHFSLEKTSQSLQIKPINNNNVLLSNIVKTYSFYSNFNDSNHKDFNNSLTKLLKFTPNSYRFYDNKIQFLILSKKYSLSSKLNNKPFTKNIEINKLNEVTSINKKLFSLILQNQFIEVQTIFAFQTCTELNVSEIFCWGTEV